MNHERMLVVAKQAAARAGAVLRTCFGDLDRLRKETKRTEAGYEGIVTQADVDAEQVVIQTIQSEFPAHQMLAEESCSEDVASEELPEHLWVIDPLDGTNNFAHALPHFAVSIAYYHQGKPTVGVILRPATHEWYWCAAGQGAWYERVGGIQQAVCNSHARLKDTMVGVGFYYDRGAMMRATLQAVEALFEEQIHGVRRMGTAALDIVQVAMGQFGAFFEYQLSPWDFAAARLFLEEAGGTITSCQGTPVELKKQSILATNSQLHEPMLSIVRRYHV